MYRAVAGHLEGECARRIKRLTCGCPPDLQGVHTFIGTVLQHELGKSVGVDAGPAGRVDGRAGPDGAGGEHALTVEAESGDSCRVGVGPAFDIFGIVGRIKEPRVFAEHVELVEVIHISSDQVQRWAGAKGFLRAIDVCDVAKPGTYIGLVDTTDARRSSCQREQYPFGFARREGVHDQTAS